VDIENLKVISRAGSIRGPARTTGYVIAPHRMVQLASDLATLDTPTPTPTITDLWLAFVKAMELGPAFDEGELADVICFALAALRPNGKENGETREALEGIFLRLAQDCKEKDYTVFCRDNDSRLRPYLTSATNPARAREKVLNERPGTTCVGVALGEINIIEWELP